MGQLYEDVETFFGDIFAFYGKLVARWPIAFILCPLVICVLLGLGLCNICYEYHRLDLFASVDSPAKTDFDRLSTLFGDSSNESFYPHQQLTQPVCASIIVSNKDNAGNIMDIETIAKIKNIYNQIKNITVIHESKEYRLEDVCAIRNGRCLIEGEDILGETEAQVTYTYTEAPLELNATHSDQEGKFIIDAPLDYLNSLSGIGMASGFATAKAIRFRFFIQRFPSEDDLPSLLWQKEFLKTMAGLAKEWTDLEVTYSASDAIDIELYTHAGRDLKLFPITVILMFAYAILIGSGGNWVSTHVILAQMGIVCTALAVLAAFGILALMGVPFVDVCGVTPFIVMGESLSWVNDCTLCHSCPNWNCYLWCSLKS